MTKKTVCPNCSGERRYSSDYDAYYCKACDMWLESRCSDPNCGYCARREGLPSEVLFAPKRFRFSFSLEKALPDVEPFGTFLSSVCDDLGITIVEATLSPNRYDFELNVSHDGLEELEAVLEDTFENLGTSMSSICSEQIKNENK